MSATMTEDEMVRALKREYGFEHNQAVHVARVHTATRFQSPLPEIAATYPRRISRGEPSEADLQIELVVALVGECVKGKPRAEGQGLAAKYPELDLLYAINPNAGHVSKRNAGKSKAMGLLPDMPDLHLPVLRGPFIGLYVELKRPGEYATREQKVRHSKLRLAGHCVVECQGVEEAAAVFLGYLALPENRPSARAVCGRNAPTGTLEERITGWRERAYLMLKPERRK